MAPSRPFPTFLHAGLGLALAGLLLAGCGGGGGSSSGGGTTTPAAPTLASIQISPASPSLGIGAALDLQATGRYSDGTSTSPFDAQVSWTSSAPAVATVDGNGVVTGVAAGTATITAAKGGVQGTVVATVLMASRTLTGISLNPTSMSLTVGAQRDIAASAIWSDGTGSTGYNGSVTWTTSNPAAATVSNLGMVTAVAAGSATITASASGKSATCAVTVAGTTAPTLTSLSLSPASGSLSVGGTLYLTPIGHYSDGSSANIVPITTVLFTSSNPSVATVDAYGIVTAAASGSATVTASFSGRSATAAISVAATPTFDTRLVGRWKWIGAPDPSGNTYGSFYEFFANGTFTYSLIYMAGTGSCITHSQVVASHAGTFSTQGGLDAPATPGKIIFNCTSHFTDYTNCAGATTRFAYTKGNPHFHWAAFSSGYLVTNHDDDFTITGNLSHLKY